MKNVLKTKLCQIKILFVEQPYATQVLSRPTGFARGCSTNNVDIKSLTESISDGLPTFFFNAFTPKRFELII